MPETSLRKIDTFEVRSRDGLVKKAIRELDHMMRAYCDTWGKPEPKQVIAHMTELMADIATGQAQMDLPVLVDYHHVLLANLKQIRTKYELTDSEAMEVLNKLISVVIRLLVIDERKVNNRITVWAE